MVETATDMVEAVVSIATGGGVLQTLGGLALGGMASASTGGIAAVGVGAAIAGWVLQQLVTSHSAMTGVIDRLNTDLGVTLVHKLNSIEQQQFDKHIDSWASRSGWRPA